MANTCWCFQESGEYTWAETGTENVSIYSNVDEKSNFTCIATINAEGKKFPLVLISKGATEVSERNWFGAGRNILNPQDAEVLIDPFLGEDKPFCPTSITGHSESRWTTQTTWMRYLHNLRFNWCRVEPNTDFYAPINTIFLLFDIYNAHFSKELINFSQILNIKLIKIPEGTIDIFQPLDCRVFGVLKNHARTYLNIKVVKKLLDIFDFEKAIFTAPTQPYSPTSKAEAVVVLEKSWDSIDDALINDAWYQSILKYFQINGNQFKEDFNQLYSLNLFNRFIIDEISDDFNESIHYEHNKQIICNEENLMLLKEQSIKHILQFDQNYLSQKLKKKETIF